MEIEELGQEILRRATEPGVVRRMAARPLLGGSTLAEEILRRWTPGFETNAGGPLVFASVGAPAASVERAPHPLTPSPTALPSPGRGGTLPEIPGAGGGLPLPRKADQGSVREGRGGVFSTAAPVIERKAPQTEMGPVIVQRKFFEKAAQTVAAPVSPRPAATEMGPVIVRRGPHPLSPSPVPRPPTGRGGTSSEAAVVLGELPLPRRVGQEPVRESKEERVLPQRFGKTPPLPSPASQERVPPPVSSNSATFPLSRGVGVRWERGSGGEGSPAPTTFAAPAAKPFDPPGIQQDRDSKDGEDMEDLAERVMRQLARTLAVERERLGGR